MVDDHSKASEELMQLAQQKGVTPPKEPGGKHKQLRDRLSKLSGAEFDRTYANERVKEHKKDVAEFRREADRGADPEVKAWAAKTLPTLQDHLKLAQEMAAEVKGTGSRSSAR
jgi:putative membrane protein